MINNKLLPISAKNIKTISDTFAKKNILKHKTILERDVKDTTLIYKKQSNMDRNMILEILYHMKAMQYTANSNFQIKLQKQYIQNILNIYTVSNELKEIKNLFFSQQNWDIVFIQKAISYIENILKKNSILNYSEYKKDNVYIFHSYDYFFSRIKQQKILNKNIDIRNKTFHFLVRISDLFVENFDKYHILFQSEINNKFFSMLYDLKKSDILKNQYLEVIQQNKKIKHKTILKSFLSTKNNLLKQQIYFYNDKINLESIVLYKKQFNTFEQYHFLNKNEWNILKKQKQLENFRIWYNKEFINTAINNKNNKTILQYQNRKRYFTLLNIESIPKVQHHNIQNIKRKQIQYFYEILNQYDTKTNIKNLYNDFKQNKEKYILLTQNEYRKKYNTILSSKIINKFNLVSLNHTNYVKFYLLKNFVKKLKQQKIKWKVFQKQIELYIQYRKQSNSYFLEKKYKNKYHNVIKELSQYYKNNSNNYKKNSSYNILYLYKIVEYSKKQNLYLNYIIPYRINYDYFERYIQNNFCNNEKKILLKNKTDNRKIKQNNVYLNTKNLFLTVYEKQKIKQYKNLLWLKINKNNEKIENNQKVILHNEYNFLSLYYKNNQKENKIYFENLLVLKNYFDKNKINYNQNKWLQSFEYNKQKIKQYKNIILLEKNNSKNYIEKKHNVLLVKENSLLNLNYENIEKNKKEQYNIVKLLKKNSSENYVKKKYDVILFEKNSLLNLNYKNIEHNKIIRYATVKLLKHVNSKNAIKSKYNIILRNEYNLIKLNYKSIKKRRTKQYNTIRLFKNNNSKSLVEGKYSITILYESNLLNLYYKEAEDETIQYNNIVLLKRNYNKKQIENIQNKIIYNKNDLLNLYSKQQKKIKQYHQFILSEKENNKENIKNRYNKMFLNKNNVMLHYQKSDKEKQKIYEKILLKKENIKYKIKQSSTTFYQKKLLYNRKQIKKVMEYTNRLYLLYDRKKTIKMQQIQNNLLLLKKEHQNNEIEKQQKNYVHLENKKEILKDNKDMEIVQKNKVLYEKEQNTIQLQQLQQIVKKEIELLLQNQIKQQQILLQQYAEEVTKEQMNFQKQFDKEKIYQQIYQKLERALYREMRQNGK